MKKKGLTEMERTIKGRQMNKAKGDELTPKKRQMRCEEGKAESDSLPQISVKAHCCLDAYFHCQGSY